MKKVFHVGKLYDGTLDRPEEDVAVLVQGETIWDVTTVSEGKRWADGATQWVDLTGKVMTPGLIDVHVHTMMKGNGEWGEDIVANYTPGEIHLIGLQNAMRALKAGVTTLRDCGSVHGVSRGLRRIFNEGILQGPDLFISGMPITSTGGHCYYMGGEADGVDEVRKLVRRQQKEGIDFVKLMATAGGTIGCARGNTFQMDECKAAVEEARRMNLKITFHACSIDGVRMAVDCGVDGIEHGMFSPMTKEGNDPLILDEVLAERIARQNIQVCHTPTAGGATLWLMARKPRCEWSDSDYKEYDRLSKAQEKTCQTMLFHYKAGVQCVAGSDSGWRMCNYEIGMPLTMQLMQQSGLPTSEVIHAATGRSAKYLGADDRLGTIAKNKQADLLVLDCDPAEDNTAFFRAHSVYKKGVPVSDFLPAAY